MHAAGSAPLESTVPGGNDKPADSEVQRQHEVEIAGIALAALVRLTRHAGDSIPSLTCAWQAPWSC